MQANKKMKYFRFVPALAVSLLLWTPLQAAAFPQNGGGSGMGESGMAGASMLGPSGKVVETMNSGGYTYALLDKGGVKAWVAIPQTTIAVGSEIVCQPGAPMANFNSTTLNRTFKTIVFSPGLASGGKAVTQAPAAAPAAPPASTPVAAAVSKAEGANAYTIGEIYEKKTDLANKPVVIQAKVVKISRGIMGKNWLHLQDGTGSQASGTHDLVVTTDAVPAFDSVVTISGNLSLDRDFGAGYRYSVIIEGAEVSSPK